MKARVKDTGEIIELCNMEYDEDSQTQTEVKEN